MSNLDTKTCTSCGQEFPLDCFYKISVKRTKPRKDNRDTTCKKCYGDKVKERAERNKTYEGSAILKRCSKCKIEKPLSAFNKAPPNKYGVTSHCKECINKGQRERYAEYGFRWNVEKRKEWVEANRDRLKAINNKCYRKSRKDPFFKIKRNLRNGLCRFLKNNIGVSRTHLVREGVGCTREELLKYIESLWWPGMNWENYGTGQGKWSIDHIKPLDDFDLMNKDESLRATHYSNLTPLWSDDNSSKNKYGWWTPAESKHELPERLKEQHGRKVA